MKRLSIYPARFPARPIALRMGGDEANEYPTFGAQQRHIYDPPPNSRIRPRKANHWVKAAGQASLALTSPGLTTCRPFASSSGALGLNSVPELNASAHWRLRRRHSGYASPLPLLLVLNSINPQPAPEVFNADWMISGGWILVPPREEGDG